MSTSGYRLLLALCMAMLAMTAAPLHAQTEPVVAKRATDLRDAPAETGRRLEALPASTPLTRLGPRQGPWVQVRTPQGRTGWLHMFDVGVAGGAAQGGGTSNGLRTFSNVFNRSAQNSTVTATSTVGIRGLGAEDIANAQPNLRAVAQMETLRIDAGTAQQFARAAALSPRSVGDLPAPGMFSNPGGGGGE